MRVLLISPLRGVDPPCGDIVHTEALLAQPPEGVVYETYAAALARNALVEHANRAALWRAWKTGEKRWLETWTTILSKCLNLLRRARLIFWEPFRIFSIRHNEYDLVHVHAFNCGFRSIDCPVAAGSDIPTRFLYTDARGYSLLRVRCIEWVEKQFAKILGVNLTAYWTPSIKRIIIPSQFSADWYETRRVKRKGCVDMVPTYLPRIEHFSNSRAVRRIGFVAKDFEAKGGMVLLEAFPIVRTAYPDAELIIVGSAPKLSDHEQKGCGISWLPLVDRDRLMREIFPSLDVFAYPTQFDGMPLVLLEAMSHGIALAATDYRAIPEMLDYGNAGLLSPVGDAPALATNIVSLLNVDTNEKFRAAARSHFEKTYSDEVVRPQLLRSYRAAVAGSH